MSETKRKYAIYKWSPSKTIQEHAKGQTPAELAKIYIRTGLLPQGNRSGQYLDTTKIPTGIKSLNLKMSLDRLWSSASASVKDTFKNPEGLLAALADPTKIDLLLSMGVIRLKKMDENPPSPVVKPPLETTPKTSETPPSSK